MESVTQSSVTLASIKAARERIGDIAVRLAPEHRDGLLNADDQSRFTARALTSAETTTYSGYLASEAKLDPTAQALGSMIKAMLLSPNFAYRTELGSSQAGTVDLTNDEIASLLSYTIADVPPDAALQAAKLSDPATRATQAQRLAALPGAKAKFVDFWSQYLALGSAPPTPGIDFTPTTRP